MPEASLKQKYVIFQDSLWSECYHGFIQYICPNLGVIWVQIEHLVANFNGLNKPLCLEVIECKLKPSTCRCSVLKTPGLQPADFD